MRRRNDSCRIGAFLPFHHGSYALTAGTILGSADRRSGSEGMVLRDGSRDGGGRFLAGISVRENRC